MSSPPPTLPPMMRRKVSRPPYPECSTFQDASRRPTLPPLRTFLNQNKRRRSPSIDSLPALTLSSPTSSYAFLPSSSPPAITPPDSPTYRAFDFSDDEFDDKKPIKRAEDDRGLQLLLTALERVSSPRISRFPIDDVSERSTGLNITHTNIIVKEEETVPISVHTLSSINGPSPPTSPPPTNSIEPHPVYDIPTIKIESSEDPSVVIDEQDQIFEEAVLAQSTSHPDPDPAPDPQLYPSSSLLPVTSSDDSSASVVPPLKVQSPEPVAKESEERNETHPSLPRLASKTNESGKKDRSSHPIARRRPAKRQRRVSDVENIDVSAPSTSSASDPSTSTAGDAITAPAKKTRKRKKAPVAVQESAQVDVPSAVPFEGDPCEGVDIPALLLDALVFGRVSFLSAPELVKGLMRDQPHLLERQDAAAWLLIARKALTENAFFGRIARHGTDPDGKKLEDTWYYDPAADPDRSRAETLAEFAPSKRRKAKMGDRTYFYAPIDMNRWVVAAELGDDA